ncbi:MULTISPECIES: transketolase family protein [unclassified Streptomyces]|uniref:transketolase family protein n=1 Tax=unclassified Streptomyces TaxID=2593676 RepID=UPI0023BA2CEB|nr:transketolase [Streptomyces sp. AM 3-1-1]WEH30897.1 transketolase [Streptomyces sp. AM 3-1-1]
MESMRDRFGTTMTTLLGEDERLAVVLAVISGDRFTEAAKRHPDRVIDLGIREQLLVSAGGGLALAGMRPVLHTFASFLVERPFEQVKLDFGHQGVGGVLVSSGASYDISSGGFTHMSPGDVALLDTLDGWTVHVPGHPDEAEALLRHAVRGEDRVYVRLSEQTNKRARPVDGSGPLVLREGRAGVVLAVGPLLDEVLAATEGLDVTVLYATTVRPFDGAALRATVDAADTADVVLVEPYLAGTSTAAVAEALIDRPHRVLGLGVGRAELRRYGSPAEHVAAHGLDAAGLRGRIGGFLGTGG